MADFEFIMVDKISADWFFFKTIIDGEKYAI